MSKTEITTAQNPLAEIENLILTIRGKQVMLDRDLARLYGVETRVLNQAVKRNIERFPDRFMFQLTDNEMVKLVTICDRFKLLKHSSSLPYAFTEHGVTMLASVLKSDIAVQISIKIVDAFVAMRHALPSYNQLYNRIENIEYHQLLMMQRHDKAENQIEEIFRALSKYDLPNQKLFFNGQLFDAHILMSQLVESAEKRIVLIDNYIDESVLTLLLKRKDKVEATIYTMQMSGAFKLDLQKHNAQYPPIAVNIYTKAHDRFLIIDDKVYHVGASVKDLGKKLCAVSLLSCIDADEMIHKM
jgi:hypothetical protein